MRRFGGYVILSLALLLFVPVSAWAAGVHYFDCKFCHKNNVSVTSLATANVCLQCHNPTYTGTHPVAPGGGGDGSVGNGVFSVEDASNSMGGNPGAAMQTSHIWSASNLNAAAGTQEPNRTAFPGFYGRYRVSDNKVTCTRCHNPHGDIETNPKLLIKKAGGIVMTPEELCLACHTTFNQPGGGHGKGTHPLVPDYATWRAVDDSATHFSGLRRSERYYTAAEIESAPGEISLVNGGIGCSTCHGAHFTDSDATTADGVANRDGLAAGDGKLLRGDGNQYLVDTTLLGGKERATGFCATCHKPYEGSHTGMHGTIGCLGCHSGHNYDNALAEGAPNSYFLLQSGYTELPQEITGNPADPPRSEIWAAPTGEPHLGFCEQCHGDLDNPADPINETRQHIPGEDCASCHSGQPDQPTGCDGCHGWPPRTNTPGGPSGFAIDTAKGFDYRGGAFGSNGGITFRDESLTAHATHAYKDVAGNYAYSCDQCHKGNNHDAGPTYQDVFIDKGGILASSQGFIPTYTGASATCAAVYCHSDGRSTRAGGATAKTVPAWQGGSTTCTSCHNTGTTGTGTVHATHLALSGLGVNCGTCHNKTSVNGSTLLPTATGQGGVHANGSIEVNEAFNTGLPAPAAFAASTGVCAVYCHSDGMGVTEVQPDWDDPSTGACGTCHVVTTDGNCLSAAHETHLKEFVTIFGGTEPDQCVRCHDHNGTTFGGQHINGVVDAPTSAAQVNAKCNPCHGATLGGTGNDAPPVWTNFSSVTCSTCHAGSAIAVVNGKTAPAKTLAETSGHNRPSGTYAVSGNSAANQQCANCHDSTAPGHFDGISGDDMRLLPAAANCTTSCHGAGGSASKNGIVTHQAYSCSACHDPHGTSNIYMVKGTSAPYSGTVVFTATTGTNSYDEADAANGDDICATCHTAANQSNQHNNKTNTGVAHNEGTDCFTCHKAHTNPAVDGGAFATGAGDSCNGCHDFPPATGAHRTGTSLSDLELHSATTLNTMAEDRTDCATCHTGAHLYTYNPAADRGNSLNHGNAGGRMTILTATVGYNSTDKTCATACHVSTVGNGGAWNATSGLNCNACHYYAANPTSAGNAGNLGGDHDAHFGTGGVVTCANCHVVDNGGAALSGPLTHITTAASGSDAVKIQGRAIAEQDEAEVTPAALGPAGSDPDPGAPTCNNMACHNPSGTTYSVMWDVNTAGCTLCHSTTNPGSGSHSAHMNAATNFGVSIACTSCHGTLPVSNAHRNGSINLLVGMNYTPAALDVGGTVGTCSTTTCHNSGTSTPVAVPTPTWGTASPDCSICHANPPATAKHAKHVSNTTYVADGCVACHTAPSASTHINGVRNLDGAKVTYTVANQTCTNSCHIANTLGDWTAGGTLACADCHGSGKVTSPPLDRGWPPAQGAHVKHLGNTQYVTGANCTDCHNNNAPTHSALDNVVTAALGTKISANPANGSCTNSCHAAAQVGSWNSAAIACVDCHAGTYIGGNNATKGFNATPTSGMHAVTPTISGQRHDQNLIGGCAACHNTVSGLASHMNGTFTGDTVANLGLQYYTQSAANLGTCLTACHVGREDWAHKWMASANYTDATASCTGCHGADLAASGLGNAGVTHRIVNAKHNGVAGGYTCRDCHALGGTGYTFSFGGNDWGGTSNHGNDVIEINSTGTSYNQTTGYCESCHTSGAYNFSDTGWTIAPVAGTAITTACGECHQGGVKPGSASGAHTKHNAGTTALVAGGAACTSCHGNNGGLGYENTLAGTHGSGTVNFAVSYSTAVRNDLTGTCSNASCHYSQATPAWNATFPASPAKCTKCHNSGSDTGTIAGSWPSKNRNGTARSDVHGAHVGNTAYVPGANCTDCHVNNTVTHNNAFDGVVQVNAGLSYNSGAGTCANSCHGGATADFRDNSPTLTCTDCHVSGKIGGGANDRTSGLHNVVPSVTGATHDDSFGSGGTCTSCHTTIMAQGTHINGAFTGGSGQTTQMGLAAFYTQTADNTGTCLTTGCHSGRDDWAHKWMATANYTSATLSCDGCHGANVALSGLGNAGVVHRTVNSKHNAVATNYTCRDCHAIEGTGYTFTFGSTDWGGASNHGNNVIEINSTGTTYNQTTGYCESCHNLDGRNFADTGWTISPVAGAPISTNCGECHAAGVKPGSASGAHTAHAAGTAALQDGGTACVPCHGDNSGAGFHNTLSGTHGSGSVNFASVTYSQAATRGNLTGTCLTSNCHNQSGTPSGAWNGTTLACNACHYYEATVNSANNTGWFAVGGSHNAHFAAAAVTACTQCHPDNSTDTVYPRTHLTGATVTAKANPVADNATLIAGVNFNDGANTCNNTACHNPSGTTYVSNAWGTPNTGCTMCHSDTDPATGSHTEHMDASANGFGVSVTCNSCHPATADPAHMNSVKNVSVAKNSVPTVIATPTAAGGCGTNDCHNNGVNLTTGTPAVSTYTWGNSITDCTECHGTATTLTSNAHNEHLNNGYGIVACADCHTAASNSNHINKNINIDNTKATYSRGASVAIGGTPSGTCLTSGCHNRAAVQSAAWNTAGDLACNACHGDASSGLSTSHTDHISAGKLCTQCHGAAPTTTAHIGGKSSLIDGSNADPGEASVLFTHADAVTDYTYNSSERSCYSPTNNGLGCHATAGSAGAADPTRPDWDVAFASTACTNCHTNTTTTAVNPTSGLHGVTPSVTGQRHNNTLAGGCVSCHTSVPQFGTHKNGTFTGGAGQTALMGLAGFYAQSADNTGTCSATSCHSGRDDWAHKWDTTTNYYTTSPSACNGCHGMALASANLGNAGVTHLAIDAMHNTGTNYLCKDCHNLEAASGYTFAFGSADWRPLDSLSSHGDGQIQINSNGTAYNESTGYCTGCHSSGPFNFADTGWTIAYAAGDSINANCGSCHGYPPTPGDGKANQAVEGKGAHAKHVSHIAALVGVPLDPNTDTYTTGASLAVCGVCHDVSTSANHHTGGGTRNLLLASSYQFGASAPAFNGTVGVSSSVNPKSCSSLDCHYQGTPVWAPVGGE